METHLLDLWHDLEEFLPVVLDCNRENSFFLLHLIGEKICKTCLEDNNFEELPLENRALVSLWNHLICGEFSPWIFRAQKEICKVHRGAGRGQAWGYSWHWHPCGGVRIVGLFKKGSIWKMKEEKGLGREQLAVTLSWSRPVERSLPTGLLGSRAGLSSH